MSAASDEKPLLLAPGEKAEHYTRLHTYDHDDGDYYELHIESALIQAQRRIGYELGRADVIRWLRERSGHCAASLLSEESDALRIAADDLERGIPPEQVEE